MPAPKVLQVHGRRQDVHTLRTPHGDNHDIWITERRQHDDTVERRRRQRVVRRRADLVHADESATSEIYGVWLDNQFPYNLYGAQQDNSTIIITSQADPYTRDGLPRRSRLRDRADHAAPVESRTSSTDRARGSSA